MSTAAKLATCDAAWVSSPEFTTAHAQPLTVMAFRAGARHSGRMPVTAVDITAALARYARRFHQVAGAGHHVASRLGAWLLLALAGPACAGDDLRQLEEILGADADAAAGFAAELLAHPHPVVDAAAAVWGGRGSATDARIASWRAGLPPQVDTGPVPGQLELDTWARRQTLGLIDRFPIEDGRALIWLLATALAARVSWKRPFDLAPASALGSASAWATTLTQVLRTPQGLGNGRRVPGHEQFIAATDVAGDVAVHAARARDGLLVVSVAAGPEVPAVDVLSAAYELAAARAAGRPLTRRSLFDLPLGEGPAWTLSEERADIAAPGGREERCTAVLPAWSARSTHQLTDPRLGFATVRHALDPIDPWQARRAAMARYTRIGFEAGAVTALAITLSAVVQRPGIRRTAELRFGHPFAVVAVAAGNAKPQDSHPIPRSPWHGLPVFSAGVADPEDATAEPNSTS
jgi:hypothetical protein